MAKPEEKVVLIVDDEEDVREYFSTVLEDAGFQVMTAQDGNEALEKVKTKRPDYISLDLVMPNKTGYKFLRELRKNKDWANIPFVIVTAHAADDLGRDDLQSILADKTFSGHGIYLEKPVIPEEYLNFICNELDVEYQGKPPSDDVYHLRNKVENLIKDARSDDLEEIIQMLKKKRG